MSSPLPAFALQCARVGKTYGSTVVTEDLNLTVSPGEICALLGPSGCGKTTTLRLIAGFEHLDTGTIAIAGRIVAAANDGRMTFTPPEQRRVGMVFQDYALFPHLTVRENVGFGLRREEGSAAEDALALVGLEALRDRMPGQLSGGQQQRVALARALAPRPDILLLDEPFSNLDASMRGRVRQEVRSILRSAGATAVLVTHDQEEAFTLADRVAVMLDGRIAQIDRAEEVYLRPKTRAIADFLGNATFLPGYAAGTAVECALGRFPLHRPATGEVSVMIRPEAACLEVEQAQGAPGIVHERQ